MSTEVNVAIVTAASMLVAGAGTIWKGLKVDRASEKSGVITSNQAGTAQIIQGFRDLLTDAMADAERMETRLRAELDRCGSKITEQDARIENMAKIIDDLKVEVNRLHRKYGDNGNPSSSNL